VHQLDIKVLNVCSLIGVV